MAKHERFYGNYAMVSVDARGYCTEGYVVRQVDHVKAKPRQAFYYVIYPLFILSHGAHAVCNVLLLLVSSFDAWSDGSEGCIEDCCGWCIVCRLSHLW